MQYDDIRGQGTRTSKNWLDTHKAKRISFLYIFIYHQQKKAYIILSGIGYFLPYERKPALKYNILRYIDDVVCSTTFTVALFKEAEG